MEEKQDGLLSWELKEESVSRRLWSVVWGAAKGSGKQAMVKCPRNLGVNLGLLAFPYLLPRNPVFST